MPKFKDKRFPKKTNLIKKSPEEKAIHSLLQEHLTEQFESSWNPQNMFFNKQKNYGNFNITQTQQLKSKQYCLTQDRNFVYNIYEKMPNMSRYGSVSKQQYRLPKMMNPASLTSFASKQQYRQKINQTTSYTREIQKNKIKSKQILDVHINKVGQHIQWDKIDSYSPNKTSLGVRELLARLKFKNSQKIKCQQKQQTIQYEKNTFFDKVEVRPAHTYYLSQLKGKKKVMRTKNITKITTPPDFKDLKIVLN